MKKIFSALSKMLLAFLAIGGIFVAVMAWRLYLSPLEVSAVARFFLKPYATALKIENATLSWPHLQSSPQLFLTGLLVGGPSFTVSAPQSIATVSFRKLLTGAVFLEDLKCIDPEITFFAPPQIPGSAPKALDAQEGLAQLLQANASLLSTLQRYIGQGEIINGKIKVGDGFQGFHPLEMQGLSSRVSITKDTLSLKGSGALHHSLLTFAYDISPTQITLNASFKNLMLRPILSAWGQQASPLFHFKDPLSGKMNLLLNTETTPFQGSVSAEIGQGPSGLKVTGHFTPELHGVAYDLTAETQDLGVKTLPTIWPPSVASSVRDWVLLHIPQGVFPKIQLALRGLILHRPGALHDTDLSGSVSLENATVLYLEGMPPVEGLSLKGSFSAADFNLQISKGHIRDMRIRKGVLLFSDLQAATGKADISLELAGPLADALWILSAPALEIPQKQGIDASSAQGKAFVFLNFKFPLKGDLSGPEVVTTVKATIKDAAFFKTILSTPLFCSQGNLSLLLGPQKMLLSGNLLIEGNPAKYQGVEYLTSGGPYVALHTLKATLQAATLTRWPAFAFLKDQITGPVAVEVEMNQVTDRDALLKIKADLHDMHVAMPLVGWKKTPQTPGFLQAVFALQDGYFKEISQFILNSPPAAAHISGTFDKGQIKLLTIEKFVMGKNNFQGSLSHEENQWHLNLKGFALDLEPYLLQQETMEEDARPNILLTTRLERVFLAGNIVLENVNVSLRRFENTWVYILAKAKIGPNQYLNFLYQPQDQQQIFVFHTENLGALLRGFRLVTDAYGGDIAIVAESSLVPEDPLIGKMSVHSIRFKNAPVLAKLLTLASISGLSDLFGEGGIHFDAGRASFVGKGHEVWISEGLLFNGSIGLTARGLLNLDQKTMHLQGTVIPAYSINHLLGYFPILGTLMSGANAETGIFSIPYEADGAFKKPDFMVNPLSMWVPVGLRNLFNNHAPPAWAEVAVAA